MRVNSGVKLITVYNNLAKIVGYFRNNMVFVLMYFIHNGYIKY